MTWKITETTTGVIIESEQGFVKREDILDDVETILNAQITKGYKVFVTIEFKMDTELAINTTPIMETNINLKE